MEMELECALDQLAELNKLYITLRSNLIEAIGLPDGTSDREIVDRVRVLYSAAGQPECGKGGQ